MVHVLCSVHPHVHTRLLTLTFGPAMKSLRILCGSCVSLDHMNLPGGLELTSKSEPRKPLTFQTTWKFHEITGLERAVMVDMLNSNRDASSTMTQCHP